MLLLKLTTQLQQSRVSLLNNMLDIKINHENVRFLNTKPVA